jgi:hypothetical protein
MLKNGTVLPSFVLTYTLVGSAPEFLTLSEQVFYSPNITFVKSILGSSMLIRAFLQVQINEISIAPVSLKIGNEELMSWFNCGVNVIVILVDRPADIRPVGVYTMWKKSLMLSESGSSLNELKENDTFVNKMV